MNRAKLNKWLFLVLFLAMTVPLAFGQIGEVLSKADAMDDAENHRGVLDLLRPALGATTNSKELSAINWRLARASLGFGDQRKDDGAPSAELLGIFTQGEAYADKAIEQNPQDPLGYFWKSSNIGRWGQTRGILESLFKAPVMRDLLSKALVMDDQHADSYYVLGQLYEAVPGGIISFGNKDYAVSLARKSVDLNKQEVASGKEDKPNYGFYLKLANQLYERNWDAAKRTREQAVKQRNLPKASNPMEKGWYYEGSISIPNITDRQEAKTILTTLIGWLQAIPARTPSQNRNLKDAQGLLSKL
jgi:tetratricopeptide (TPR) repeat protein